MSRREYLEPNMRMVFFGNDTIHTSNESEAPGPSGWTTEAPVTNSAIQNGQTVQP